MSSKYNNYDFIEVYSYLEALQVNINDLKEGVRYVFKNLMLNKSVLADFIENNACIIDARIIKQFFYDASSSHYGFRRGAMKCLYEKTFLQKYDSSLSANKFWEEHNKIKENVFRHHFGEIKNGFFIPKDKEQHKELLRYTETTTKASVVVYSRYLSKYCDDIFDVGIVR